MSLFLSFFLKKIVDPDNGDYFVPTTGGYTALVIIMILLLLLACYIGGKEHEKKGRGRISTKQLVFSAAAIALAMITSFIKLYHLPMGGSVTLFSMLFICLIGYWYGLRTGLMAAVAYGILQLVSDPYVISIPQMFVDYIFAFGALGLSGLFSGKKNGLIKGYIVGVLGRYFFAFLSGLIFFGSYADGSGMIAPIYSLVYNGSYLGAEAVLTLVVLALPPMRSAMSRISTLARSEDAAA